MRVTNRLDDLERRFGERPPEQRSMKQIVRDLRGHPEAYRAACEFTQYADSKSITSIDEILADQEASRLANKYQRELSKIEDAERQREAEKTAQR